MSNISTSKAKKKRKPRKKKPQSLQALRKTWYDKLAAEGFEDIEWTGTLDSQYLAYVPTPASMTEMHERITYFNMAEAYLADYRLKGRDRFIWKLHSQGLTYREITEQHNKKYKPVSIYSIHNKVQTLLKRCKAFNDSNPAGIFYNDEQELSNEKDEP